MIAQINRTYPTGGKVATEHLQVDGFRVGKVDAQPVIGIVMGSWSDWEVMSPALAVCDDLLIPVEAVFVTAAGPVAYRVRGDDVAAVPLTLGRRNATTIEVTAGLAVGDRVAKLDPTRSAR